MDEVGKKSHTDTNTHFAVLCRKTNKSSFSWTLVHVVEGSILRVFFSVVFTFFATSLLFFRALCGGVRNEPNISYYMTKYRQQLMQMLELVFLCLRPFFSRRLCCCCRMLSSTGVFLYQMLGYISQIPINMCGTQTFFSTALFPTGFGLCPFLRFFRTDGFRVAPDGLKYRLFFCHLFTLLGSASEYCFQIGLWFSFYFDYFIHFIFWHPSNAAKKLNHAERILLEIEW